MSIPQSLAVRALDAANDGVTISDALAPDLPLIYVNRAFERLTGYDKEEILGRNCRFLQGNLPPQQNLVQVRHALENFTNCRVRIKNMRKDGSTFWNELSLSPIFDDVGRATHFVGIQKNVTKEVGYKEHIQFLSQHDYLTELYNTRGFFSHAAALIKMTRSFDRCIFIAHIELKGLKEVRRQLGFPQGDGVLAIFAKHLKAASQETDILARSGDENFLVASHAPSIDVLPFEKVIVDVLKKTQQETGLHDMLSVSLGMIIEKPDATTQLERLLCEAELNTKTLLKRS
ncbi:MAG: hypothetical protein DHS20C10_01760 [marine bacterium B5-7]|nr:MAG: hypothetical protein DHS20C10_01760 [marine bacterium B5-7]